jgi:hypothetical protein
MKSKKRRIFFFKSGLISISLLTILTLASCSSYSTLSTRASRVRLVSALQAHQVESECEFLGNVTGLYTREGCCLCLGYPGCWTYNNKALNQLLDHAAELGATHVFVNLGNNQELRGEAYLCAYCQDVYGDPDIAYCELPDGTRDMGFCQDIDGNIKGQAHCENAIGQNKKECEENCGKWVPAVDREICGAWGFIWVPKANSPEDCKARGGTWRPIAKDKVTCESKEGIWVINEDVLRRAPSPIKEKED